MMRSPYISFVGALVLLIAAGAGYGIWYHIVISESTRLSLLTEQADAKGSDTVHMIASKAALRALFSNEEAVAGYFLSSGDVVSFLERLQDTGHALGSEVSVVSVSTIASVASDGSALPDRLALSLTITGSFEEVMKTIGTIEYGPYDMSITNLTIGSTPNEKKQIVWTANGLFSVGTHPMAPPPTTP